MLNPHLTVTARQFHLVARAERLVRLLPKSRADVLFEHAEHARSQMPREQRKKLTESVRKLGK